MLKARYRIVASLIVLLLMAGALGCASTKRAPQSPESVVFHHNDHLLGCHEVGLLAKTDGCVRLSRACCAVVEHSPPTREHAIALAARAAKRLGANAILVLDVAQEDNFLTDCEGCCAVTSYRAYGIAFKCSDDMLGWHLKHENDPNF